MAVDPRADILGHFAFEELREPIANSTDFEPALDLALRVGQDLAVLGRNDGGEASRCALRKAAGTG